MRYVIVRADGGLSIMPPRDGDESAKTTFEKWKQSARPEWLPARLEKTDAPLPDQTFHGSRMSPGPKWQPADNAFVWDDSTKCVRIDMALARENYCKRRLRLARAPLLSALDMQFMRAVESGDQAAQADIAARKRELRDVTADPAIASARTPEELKAVWPSCLAVTARGTP